MPRVVPSQIVSLINDNPPSQRAGRAEPSPTRTVSHVSIAVHAGVVRLIDELPSELLTISGTDYDDLVCGAEAIRNAIAYWQHKGVGEIGLQPIRDKHPLVAIRDALAKCPDQAPSETTAELSFIADKDLRDSIRSDISSADAALHDGQWKGATVLAGAAAEALLLWAITDAPNIAAVQPPKGSPDTWGLGDYIRVAGGLGLINPQTVVQAELAQGFRNLIHPGRSHRLQQVCDRGTALSALAAVESIARDLAWKRARNTNATKA